MNVDILPTLVKICGAKQAAPAGPLDGQDVSAALMENGKSPPPRDLYFFNGQSGLQNEELAVTTPDDWKLIVKGPDVRRPEGYQIPQHHVELYQLNDDPLEQKDLSAAESQRVKELAEKLVAFRKSEPAESLPPLNRKPPRFRPPPHWRNAPSTRPAD